jgi:hypothetical protein
MALSVGEYVGTGTATRDLVVTGFEPVCVWVLGVDTAGDTIGAFKIRGMADGISHPWERNPATGGPSRANRILTLNPDGFSVGIDLNTLGQPYQYICWPLQGGITGYGSYGGNGWSRTASTALMTNAGTFQTPLGPQFRPLDVGQTVRRVADGAIIGTLTGYISAQEMTGVIHIADGFLAGAWEFVPRQIPLGFPPDFVMLCALSQLTTLGNPEPIQIAPGRGISDSLVSSQDFQGTGLSPAVAFVQPGSSNLEVLNETATGTPGYNGLGVNYVWFAFRTAGLEDIPIDMIDYDGDNTFNREITGTTFIPTFFMVFGGPAGVLPRWYHSEGLVTPGGDSRRFQDGTPLVSFETFTMLGNGIRMSANALNVTGKFYRAYFLMPGVDLPNPIGTPGIQQVASCSAFTVCPCFQPC